MKLVGLAGWSGSGKTRLLCALIENISARGLKISSIKHAHHSFDIDKQGKDSYLHRKAGAQEVMIASEKRWALMHERADDEPMPSPIALTKKMQQVDVLLVEGFKKFPLDKLEVYRHSLKDDSSSTLRKPLLTNQDSRIRAIVSDIPIEAPIKEGKPLPVFDANDISSIADFILNQPFFAPPTKDIVETQDD